MADNKYKLQFTLSNGETINAGEIVAPQGPKGDKGDKGDSADIPYSSSTPFMDGTGSAGSANAVARGDHRHPSDTTRQEKLVSGENIKTINGQSVLGSGDIPISGGGTSEYANTSETVELTKTYTSLNTLCSDILTNKTKVSYVAYSKISGITVFTIPLGTYSSENGYVYFKFVGNGRTVTDSTSVTDQYIEVFYLDRRAQYDKRTYIGHLYLGDAQSLAADWGFTGWRIPTYGTSTATNINYRGFSETVYIWQDSQNGAYWKVDSTGIVRYYQGQIRDRVLISGTNGNTKTINGETIYGSGDITVGGSKYYKHYLEIDFVHNTSSETATIYMTDTNYAANTISDAAGFVNSCFPVQEEPSYPVTYHEATGFYGSTPVVAIKYTASKIYAVTTTGEKEITPDVGMWLVTDYVVDLSTNMKPVTT